MYGLTEAFRSTYLPPEQVDLRPDSIGKAIPNAEILVLREDGSEAGVNEGGLLVIDKPFPSMLRTIWGDDERYVHTYFSKWPGRPDLYFPGDGAKRDEDGYYWILGRVDDVLNVAGHRIGTMEVESAIVSHADVAEAAVVGRPDDITGTAIVAFVTPKKGKLAGDALRQAVRAHVTKEIGALARPSDIRFTDSLPKTRSGKIMRRLLRDIASGVESSGDTTTLEDFSVLAKLRESDED